VPARPGLSGRLSAVQNKITGVYGLSPSSGSTRRVHSGVRSRRRQTARTPGSHGAYRSGVATRSVVRRWGAIQRTSATSAGSGMTS
jgi:hypothetical protein